MQVITMIGLVGLTLMCMSVGQAAQRNGNSRYVHPFERYILHRLFFFETSTVSRVNSLAEQVEELAALNGTETTINGTDLGELENCVAELKQNVTTLDTGLTGLEGNVSSLSTTSGDQQVTLDSLVADCNCTDFENRITSLENDVVNLLQMIEELANSTDGGETIEDGTLRLIGSIDPNEGRLEVYLMGMWGTVCDELWSFSDAVVACRQLGLQGGEAVSSTSSPYGQGTGPVWLSKLVCAGTEERLIDCSSTATVGMTGCNHSRDAALVCTS